MGAGLPSKVQGKAELRSFPSCPSLLGLQLCSLPRSDSHDGFLVAGTQSCPKGPKSHLLCSLLGLFVIFRFLKKSANKEEFLPALMLLFPSSLGNVPSPCSDVSPRSIHPSSHNPLPKKASCWETILLPSGAIKPAFLLSQAFIGFVKT